MAERKPLVLVGGELRELPAGDTLAGAAATRHFDFSEVFPGTGGFVANGLASGQVGTYFAVDFNREAEGGVATACGVARRNIPSGKVHHYSNVYGDIYTFSGLNFNRDGPRLPEESEWLTCNSVLLKTSKRIVALCGYANPSIFSHKGVFIGSTSGYFHAANGVASTDRVLAHNGSGDLAVLLDSSLAFEAVTFPESFDEIALYCANNRFFSAKIGDLVQAEYSTLYFSDDGFSWASTGFRLYRNSHENQELVWFKGYWHALGTPAALDAFGWYRSSDGVTWTQMVALDVSFMQYIVNLLHVMGEVLYLGYMDSGGLSQLYSEDGVSYDYDYPYPNTITPFNSGDSWGEIYQITPNMCAFSLSSFLDFRASFEEPYTCYNRQLFAIGTAHGKTHAVFESRGGNILGRKNQLVALDNGETLAVYDESMRRFRFCDLSQYDEYQIARAPYDNEAPRAFDSAFELYLTPLAPATFNLMQTGDTSRFSWRVPGGAQRITLTLAGVQLNQAGTLLMRFNALTSGYAGQVQTGATRLAFPTGFPTAARLRPLPSATSSSPFRARLRRQVRRGSTQRKGQSAASCALAREKSISSRRWKHSPCFRKTPAMPLPTGLSL